MATPDRSAPGVGSAEARRAPGGMRIPFEGAARRLNRNAHLYLSDGQQRQLAAALFAGAILVVAGIAYSLGRASRQYLP